MNTNCSISTQIDLFSHFIKKKHFLQTPFEEPFDLEKGTSFEFYEEGSGWSIGHVLEILTDSSFKEQNENPMSNYAYGVFLCLWGTGDLKFIIITDKTKYNYDFKPSIRKVWPEHLDKAKVALDKAIQKLTR